MPRNEQVIRALHPQHFDTHQDRRDHDGMHAIDADAVNPLQPAERGSVLIHKARISSEIGHGAAGFDTAKDVALCQVLVLNRDRGLAVVSCPSQLLQCERRAGATPALARTSRWSRECFRFVACALILDRPLDSDGLSQCSPNHFFRTSCPTAIEARIGYRDCEIVAAPITALAWRTTDTASNNSQSACVPA